MERSPLLTIITCTWNSETYLKDCIDSVKNQKTTHHIEHLFIDGFSTDTTLELLYSYQKEAPHNFEVKIIQSEAKWVYNAMNIGIQHAKGKYLLFLNSDDFLAENILDDYLLKTASHKDVYYGNMSFFRGDGSGYNTSNFHFLRKILGKIWLHVLFYHPTCLIKKEVFEELGYYDETKKIASDYGLWLKVVKNYKKTEYFPKIVAHFRIHQDSLSTSWKYKNLSKQEMAVLRKQEFWFFGTMLNWIWTVTEWFTGKYM